MSVGRYFSGDTRSIDTILNIASLGPMEIGYEARVINEFPRRRAARYRRGFIGIRRKRRGIRPGDEILVNKAV